MKVLHLILVTMSLGLMILLCGCTTAPSGGTATPAVTTPAGIANPAAVYCTQQAGTKYEIRTNSTDGSQYGVCILPDGTVCDEWAYFRKECPAPAVTRPAKASKPRGQTGPLRKHCH